jgi:hypothetical protein
MKVTVFWEAALCSLVKTDSHFIGAKAVDNSETLAVKFIRDYIV